MSDNLKTVPRKSKNMNHFQPIIEPKSEYQIEMMFMTYDCGYRYIFVSCDISTTYAYGLPTKSKQPSEILECFKILEEKLQFAKGCIFTSDNGSEFRGVFQQYLKNHEYIRQNTEIGNYRQLCYVNNAILHLTRAICDDKNEQWVERLGDCIRTLNLSRAENQNKTKMKKKIVY